MTRVSTRRLLELLMALLQSPEVALSKGHLKREHGVTTYDRDPSGFVIDIRITIDTRNTAVVSTVVHELLHVYLWKYHETDRLFSSALEEAMVQGLEEALEKYLHSPKNERLFQSWVKAVEAKLG